MKVKGYNFPTSNALIERYQIVEKNSSPLVTPDRILFFGQSIILRF